MSRDLPTGMAAEFAASTVRLVHLVKLEWPSGTVYAWSGYGNISWDTQTWIGTGHLGTISAVRESSDGSANGVSLTLSGIPSAEIARALEGDSQGMPGKIYRGTLNGSGLFDYDPYLIFDGVIDVCPIEDDGQSASITVQLEKELIDSRTRGRRYTHEDQQIENAGDLGFEYVAGLADKEITWGTAKVRSAVIEEPSESSDDYSG